MEDVAAVEITATGLKNCAHVDRDPLSCLGQFLLEFWPSLFQEGLRKGSFVEFKIRGNRVQTMSESAENDFWQ